jgi:hypothetical protein
MEKMYCGKSVPLLKSKKMKNIKKEEVKSIFPTIILIFLFFVGWISFGLLCLYILGTVMYVASGSEMHNFGNVAFIPKWVFALSLLLFLIKTKAMRNWVER